MNKHWQQKILLHPDRLKSIWINRIHFVPALDLLRLLHNTWSSSWITSAISIHVVGVLHCAVPHQIVRVFKGDTIPLKCPHDPKPIDKVVVQRGDEQGNDFEVLFKCERNQHNTVICRNRMDDVVDQTVNWTNGIFYDSIFHISHASFYNIGRYSCNYYNDGQYLTNNSIHVDVLGKYNDFKTRKYRKSTSNEVKRNLVSKVSYYVSQNSASIISM